MAGIEMNDDLMNKMLEEINKGIVWKRAISFDFDALVKLRIVIHGLLFERDIFHHKLDIAKEAIAHAIVTLESNYEEEVVPNVKIELLETLEKIR